MKLYLLKPETEDEWHMSVFLVAARSATAARKMLFEYTENKDWKRKGFCKQIGTTNRIAGIMLFSDADDTIIIEVEGE